MPECRPIEDFCSILKGKVYKDNWQAKNLIQLRSGINKCLGEVDIVLVQGLDRSILHRVDKIKRNGLVEEDFNLKQ